MFPYIFFYIYIYLKIKIVISRDKWICHYIKLKRIPLYAMFCPSLAVKAKVLKIMKTEKPLIAPWLPLF